MLLTLSTAEQALPAGYSPLKEWLENMSPAFPFLLLMGATTVLFLLLFLLIDRIKRKKMGSDKNIVEAYQKLFFDIDLKSVTGVYPVYMMDQEKQYLQIISFRTLIPLKEWEKKQCLIETYLNVKIVKIRNAQNDNNTIEVHVIKNELPHNIPWDDSYMTIDTNILNLGISYENEVSFDLNKNAHCFIAGETGSGKSVLLKGLIYQSLIKGHEVKLIDFKRGVSFAIFDKYINIYSEHGVIEKVLKDLVNETNRRYDLFKQYRVDHIKDYNQISGVTKFKRIVVFIDELAELIKSSDKETTKIIVECLETLTRISRAAGINLIMGIQRPDSTIISGQIKNNVTFRVCGRFVDPEPSRIMLSNDKAMHLPDIKGRFIVKDRENTEFQAFYFTELSMNIDMIPVTPHNAPVSPVEPIMATEHEEATTNPTRATRDPLEFNFEDIKL